ncbi:uncharacterized protein Bfra_010717 [Botrytis fragariae]|uniref:DUF7708 domain-containing protein n=1 Tax=Botrytis fragariae TaxID=1964551 RepID=A0A8H6AI12_9HELO|nr:uncharacterized protein Bfra_010717 [Botrytis fragariae]KAF5867747.1 hypothetical protein Bfra_010717 [Botrytis fragariae]
MTFNAEGLYLVRRFSELTRNEKIAEPLSQGLAEKVDHDIERERKGKYFYEEVTQKSKKVNQITGNYGHDLYSLPGFFESKLSNLEEKSDKLSVAWRNLEDKLKLDKTGVPATSANNGTDILLLTIQLQRDILQKKRESKGAKVKNFLKRTIQSLENHKYLFALLPSGDKYTSVLTGAFSALVKASVTHSKIADEISDALDDVSDQVRSFGIAAATTRYQRSAYIKCHITEFYIQLFDFLEVIIREWYQSSWKRFSKSLGRSFLEETVQKTVQRLQTYTTRVAAEERHISEEQNHMQLLQIGNMVHKLLLDNKELKERLNEISPPTTPESKRQRGSVGVLNHSGDYSNSPNSSLNSTPRWSKNSMLKDSGFLRQYIQASVDVDRLIVMGQSLVVNADISTRIRQWIIAPSSGILWIEGPHGVEQPGQNTLVSAFVLRNLRLAHLPVMAEFCHYDTRDWRRWNPATELLKVVYGLIGQTMNMMEDDIETNGIYPDFSAERFQRLKENADALPAAIQLLADLISVGPALQFCIIDGLEIFDGCEGGTLLNKSFKDLITLICKSVVAKSFPGRERIFKVLFTTNGFVSELADCHEAESFVRLTYDDEEEDELLTYP